jgi:hypothetical protein
MKFCMTVTLVEPIKPSFFIISLLHNNMADIDIRGKNDTINIPANAGS